MRRVLWIGLLGLAASSVVSQAQNASAISLYGDQGKSTAVASNEVGVASSDLLPGNGTRAGYTLRYAPIIPGSESVYIDGRRLKRDADYFLDRDSGTIAFAEPVRRSSSVTIHYRYSKNGQATNGAKARRHSTLPRVRRAAISSRRAGSTERSSSQMRK